MPKQQKAGTGTFSNLKSYLQAAQGGGQQKVAQAATQQVQKLGTGAQKGIGQAHQTFGQRVEAGSLANMGTAGQEAQDIIGTARGVTYQAPQQPAQTEAVAQTQEAATEPTTPQAQQYFTPEQQQRFAEIINAQYQGPQSLQEAGLYESAAQKARTAQEAALKSQTAGGRELLLKDIFGRGRDYSRGASKLDALLLNTSRQGLEQLQEQAKSAGGMQQQLQAAQNQSAAEAQNRARAIEDIRSGARGEFTTARADEELGVEKRIDDLIKTPVKDATGKDILKSDGTPMTQWDQLPEYFKDILRKTPKGGVKLSTEELAILGVRPGEGLYNLGVDAIKQASAERGRLITKDELSRQLALQQLSQLDTSNQLQKDLTYTDLDKAGTQNLLNSLDVKGIRDVLNAEQAEFNKRAKEADLMGKGKKKVSKGNWAGTKTATYYAQQKANVADLLKQAGYDTDKLPDNMIDSMILNPKDLNKYLEATKVTTDSIGNRGFSGTEGALTGASSGAAIGSLVPGVGTGIGAGIGGAVGAAIGTNTLDSTQAASDILKELEQKYNIPIVGSVGEGVQDLRTGAGNVYKESIGKILNQAGLGDLGKGIGGIISGIDTGKMKREGTAKAKELARKDLEKKVDKWLKDSGFSNRLTASKDNSVLARSEALRDLLSRKG
jgi:hypothetical protein